jgi:phage nucleotide-binding protein
MPKTIEVTHPDELVDAWGVNMFLTGQPGAGKTFLIGSATEVFSGEILIADIEGGMRTLADHNDIDVVVVTKWKQLTDIYDVLALGGHKYKLVAIDLASEAYKLALDQAMSEGLTTRSGQPTLEAWGVANTRFIKLMRDYRLLAVEKGVHVVFTAHSNEVKDETTGAVLIRPNLTPGTLASVLGAVDVVGYMELSRKKRLLHLVGSDRILAKARMPATFGIVPDSIEDPTFVKLVSALQGGAGK